MKYNVIDLFCGCGGLSNGFLQSGYNIIGGVDFNQAAINTYNHNFPNAKGICCDISQMDVQMIKSIYKDWDKIDIVIGGPPCQGFSAANRYKSENDDPRNKLFYEFVKFVDLVNPKAIVIENVKGIVTMNEGYALKNIYEIFEKRGYSLTHKVLNAIDYGIPQKRQRNFIVMIKGEVKFDFEEITHFDNVVTVSEAIGELYEFDNKGKEAFQVTLEPKTKYQKYLRAKNNVIENHEGRYPAVNVQHRISFVPQGGNWSSVPIDLWPNERKNRHSSAYKRLDEKKPSVTIDTGNNHSNYFHPLYNRIPTVREAARLQSFRDDFIFCGNRSEQYRQVGNAVPPLLARAIAEELKVQLSKGDLKDER